MLILIFIASIALTHHLEAGEEKRNKLDID